MECPIDVMKVADELLEKGKAILQEKGSLPSTGFVLEMTGRVTVVDLGLHDKEAKNRAMQRLGQLAREVNSIAVFTITDSVYRCFPPEGKEPPPPIEDPARAENLKPDGKPRACISLEIKVPGQTPTIIMVPYRRDRLGKIQFGPHEQAPLDFRGPEPPDSAKDEDLKD